jgi:hypothetical protein
MHILNRSRLYLIALLVIGLILAAPAWAQQNDILSYRVLSQSPNELVIEVQSYYTGSHGATVWLSVIPTVNAIPTQNVAYGGPRCPNNNSIAIGLNLTCMSLKNVRPGMQFISDGLEICFFGGTNQLKWLCKTIGHTKQWGP